jgi:hypothetical protein
MKWFPSRGQSASEWFRSAPWYVQAFYNFGVIVIIATALAGCSTAEPGVEVRVVRVPTPVACVPLEAIPAEPPQVGALLTGSASHDLTIVAESALLLRAWGQEMAAALHACAD